MVADKSNLVINLKEENNIKIERRVEDIKTSIFRENYIDALSNMSDILSIEDKNVEDDDREINNLIVFTGNRGSGKSSCMYSFAKIVEDISSGDKDILKLKELTAYEDEGESKNIDFKKIKKAKFVNIKTIDPSLFEGNNNILEIVISNMFFTFKTRIEDENYSCNDDVNKRKLLSQFQKVHKSLKTLNKTKKEIFDEDMLESLINISNSTNIKGDLEILIGLYSEFMLGKDSKKESNKLLIRIDDIDLNTKHAYEMVEQIRKYLMLPNVVILMAVKLEQLFEIIKQENIKEFEKSLKQEEMDTNQITLITERYLEKLVPVNRRNYMPGKNKINLDTEVTIKCKNGRIKKYISVSVSVESSIYIKTGLVFLTNSDNVNYIIPENLREIKQLLGFLEDMDDIKKTTREKIDMSLEVLNLDKIKFEECLKENSKILMLEYMIKCYVRFYETIKSKGEFLVFNFDEMDKEYAKNILDSYYIEFKDNYNQLISNKENLKNTNKKSEIDSLISKLSVIEKLKYYKSEFEDVKGNISKLKSNKNHEASKMFLDKFDFYKRDYEKINLLCFIINEEENSHKSIRNIERFRRYFIENWAYENLKSSHREIINEFIEAPTHMKNKNLVMRIESEFDIINEQIDYEKKGGKKNQNNLIETNEYLDIINKSNNPYNISLGDVRVSLKKLNFNFEDISVKKFVFAVNTLYSLELYSLNFGNKDKEKYRRLIGNGVINNEFTKVLSDKQKNVLKFKNEDDKYSKSRQSFKKLYSDLINENVESILDKTNERRNVNIVANIFNFMHTTINPLNHMNRFKLDKDDVILESTFNNIINCNFSEKEVYIGNLEMLNDITQNLMRDRKTTFGEYIRALKNYSYLSETKILHYRENNFLKLYQNHSDEFDLLYLSQIENLSVINFMGILIKVVKTMRNKTQFKNEMPSILKLHRDEIKLAPSGFDELIEELIQLNNMRHSVFEGLKNIFAISIFKLVNEDINFTNKFLKSEIEIINKYLINLGITILTTDKKDKEIIFEKKEINYKLIFDGYSEEANEGIFSQMTFSYIKVGEGYYKIDRKGVKSLKSILARQNIALHIFWGEFNETKSVYQHVILDEKNLNSKNIFNFKNMDFNNPKFKIYYKFKIYPKCINSKIESSIYDVKYEDNIGILKFSNKEIVKDTRDKKIIAKKMESLNSELNIKSITMVE